PPHRPRGGPPRRAALLRPHADRRAAHPRGAVRRAGTALAVLRDVLCRDALQTVFVEAGHPTDTQCRPGASGSAATASYRTRLCGTPRPASVPRVAFTIGGEPQM